MYLQEIAKSLLLTKSVRSSSIADGILQPKPKRRNVGIDGILARVTLERFRVKLSLGHDTPQEVLIASLQYQPTPRVPIARCRSPPIPAEDSRAVGEYPGQVGATLALVHDRRLDVRRHG